MTDDSTVGPVEIEVLASNQQYLVQQQGGDLRIGRQAGHTILWQEESVPVADLPEAARAALARGETDDADLQRSLQAVVEAFVHRGG